MRKGQAAMEFLMTYGWAILALMTALGALAYFGVISPAKSLPEKCIFGNSLICKDVRLNTTVANMTLINGLGQTIYPIRADPETGSFTGPCVVSSATVVSDGIFRVDCRITSITPKLQTGQGAKIKVKITFKKTVGGYDHISLGEMYSLVQ